jgi:hypothetical protein
MPTLIAAPAQQVSAAGNTSWYSTTGYRSLAVDVNVTGLTGTGASVTFVIERETANGEAAPVWSSPAVTTVGMVSASIGPGLQVPACLGDQVRLRWTLSSGATATFSYSVIAEA